MGHVGRSLEDKMLGNWQNTTGVSRLHTKLHQPTKKELPKHMRFVVCFVEILVSKDYFYDKDLWENC